jgi:hypothetical protein
MFILVSSLPHFYIFQIYILPDFYIVFYNIAKNLKEYFYKLLSYPVYSQIG